MRKYFFWLKKFSFELSLKGTVSCLDLDENYRDNFDHQLIWIKQFILISPKGGIKRCWSVQLATFPLRIYLGQVESQER